MFLSWTKPRDTENILNFGNANGIRNMLQAISKYYVQNILDHANTVGKINKVSPHRNARLNFNSFSKK
jgi:hypothetical protein